MLILKLDLGFLPLSPAFRRHKFLVLDPLAVSRVQSNAATVGADHFEPRVGMIPQRLSRDLVDIWQRRDVTVGAESARLHGSLRTGQVAAV